MKPNKELIKFNEFVDSFGLEDNTIDELGVIVKKSRYVYAVHPALRKEMESISLDFFSIGTPLGEIKKEFMPTPEFIDFLSKHSDRKVFVDEKSEWMFLCGKDIFTKGVRKICTKNKRGRAFIQNALDENLGIARFCINGNVVLRHILDKGAYIRKEA